MQDDMQIDARLRAALQARRAEKFALRPAAIMDFARLREKGVPEITGKFAVINDSGSSGVLGKYADVINDTTDNFTGLHPHHRDHNAQEATTIPGRSPP